MFNKEKVGSDNAHGNEQKFTEKGNPFESVLDSELTLLNTLRDARVSQTTDLVFQRAFESNMVGLALSGGGIRSATFNLGVIQALSNSKLLSKFDYLSTVSGGGFIGGWLSALLHRQATRNGKVDEQAVREFQNSLKTHPDNSGLENNETVGFKAVEHKAVRYLRGYSNYLSPQLGLSGDALAAAAIFLRNFVLIQLTLISLVASILLIFHSVGAASIRFGEQVWPLELGALLLVVAVLAAAWLSAVNQMPLKVNRMPPQKNNRASVLVSCCVIIPCVIAAWAFCIVIVTPNNPFNPGRLGFADNAYWWRWLLAGAFSYGAAWGLGFFATNKIRSHYAKSRYPEESTPSTPEDDEDAGVGSWFPQLLAAAVAGGVLGLLMFATVHEISAVGMWHAVAFGPPLFLLALSFVVTIHIGGAGRAFTEPDREWFARLGGFVLWVCTTWALIFSLILYATPFVQWLAHGKFVALVTWAAGSGIGAGLAHGSATGSKKDSILWKELAARIAPWLFVAGLGVIVAYATHLALLTYLINWSPDVLAYPPDSAFYVAATNTIKQLDVLGQPEVFPKLLWALAGTVFALVVFAWRFDINLFSLHAMYCNRIARAFLGASSVKRWPNPFTGFDHKDDVRFDELKNQRPIPIINTAINMTGGDDLAWQTRRAASFAFTPAWAGYETRSTQGNRLGAYRPTRKYAGRRKLGTLMAVSGAAASPNMGYHTKPGVAALMTAFNLRLGLWCGNPTRDGWDEESPQFSAKLILKELMGSATAQADWINLTDGGHFDNLGVYELIRRRCRLIVVSDAGCDPNYQFEDLSNTIIKCWTDLGVNIRFEHFTPMYRTKGSRYGDVHGVVGRIEYDSAANLYGAIIYLKSSMTGDEWPDIRQYADTHDKFPHESTADQFFDENQFEAYRHLGYKVAAKMVKELSEICACDIDAVHVIPIDKMIEKLVTFASPERQTISNPGEHRGDLA